MQLKIVNPLPKVTVLEAQHSFGHKSQHLLAAIINSWSFDAEFNLQAVSELGNQIVKNKSRLNAALV